MNQMNEMYSLGPGPRVAVSQHNTLQARGFFLDAQHFIQHRVEQLEDLKLHLIHSRPLRVAPQPRGILGSALQLNVNKVRLLPLTHRLEGLEVHLGDW